MARTDLPRQRRGTVPQMHGRYPDYNCLEHASHWDELTRRAVLARVENVPERRFFDDDEAATLEAFCDVVLAQDGEPRIPVLAFVDAKLADGKLDGFRYTGMPQGCGERALMRRRHSTCGSRSRTVSPRATCRSGLSRSSAPGRW